MANCQLQFLAFDKALNISPTSRKKLGSAHKSVRKHIETYFKKITTRYEFKRFKVQGSKVLGTLIKKYGEECDIDIGVYFYPKPDITAESLLKAVHKAFVVGHSTQFRPELKKRCVRVHYAGKYHIDLPVYYLERLRGRGQAYLATRDGYIKNDPREFEDWFKVQQQGGTQLVRLIRYLKAWCHHVAEGRRMPQGVALTAMAGQIYKPYERDDEALLNVIRGVEKTLTRKWTCLMPVVPHDEVLKRFTESDKIAFLEKLNLFASDAEKAVKVRSVKSACTYWKNHLGRHFQIPD